MPFRLTQVSRACAIALALAGALFLTAPAFLARETTQAAAQTLPTSLTSAQFWKLVGDISEPGGYFRITDNYTSNEGEIGQIFTILREQNKAGGAYIGVGPEQNLTYISAIKPSVAFVIDIRRQAVMQHLMFKAMFEMARDRADFISLLFAKARPDGLDATTPIQQMWESFFTVGTDSALADKTKTRVIERLTKTHGFALNEDEKWQLDSVLRAFVEFGPAITTRGGPGRGGGGSMGFADLTGWSPAGGPPRSFLSSEEHFQTVKTLHEKNLIVPVSGDFAGPKALRAIGTYLRERGTTVTAFYVSNVEQYLFQDGKSGAFYENVATLPLTEASVFIRPYSMRRYGTTAALCGIAAFLKNVQAGRVISYNDALPCYLGGGLAGLAVR